MLKGAGGEVVCGIFLNVLVSFMSDMACGSETGADFWEGQVQLPYL